MGLQNSFDVKGAQVLHTVAAIGALVGRKAQPDHRHSQGRPVEPRQVHQQQQIPSRLCHYFVPPEDGSAARPCFSALLACKIGTEQPCMGQGIQHRIVALHQYTPLLLPTMKRRTNLASWDTELLNLSHFKVNNKNMIDNGCFLVSLHFKSML